MSSRMRSTRVASRKRRQQGRLRRRGLTLDDTERYCRFAPGRPALHLVGDVGDLHHLLRRNRHSYVLRLTSTITESKIIGSKATKPRRAWTARRGSPSTTTGQLLGTPT